MRRSSSGIDDSRIRKFRLWPIANDVTVDDLRLSLGKEGHLQSVQLEKRLYGDGLAAIVVLRLDSSSRFGATSYKLRVPGRSPHVVGVKELGGQHLTLYSSPCSTNKFPEIMVIFLSTDHNADDQEIQGSSLDFGIMLTPSKMGVFRTVEPTYKDPIILRLNMRHRELSADFPLVYEQPSEGGSGFTKVSDFLRFRIPLQFLKDVFETKDEQLILSFTLPIPPKYFRKLEYSLPTAKTGYWHEQDAWFRQTDISADLDAIRRAPISIRKTDAILDLGTEPKYERIHTALRDHNVQIIQGEALEVEHPAEPEAWQLLRKEQEEQEHLLDSDPPLAFDVRYQLEACISLRTIDEHDVSREFLNRIALMAPAQARRILEEIAIQGERVYDPVAALEKKAPRPLFSAGSLPGHCILSRSATVTPTSCFVNTPAIETSNRILRSYPKYADRFIRVRFTEERREGKIYPDHKMTSNEVYTRIKRTLRNGIQVAGRRFEWLASGNSQFREHGAYFFAPVPELSTQDIRRWMGSFEDITNVALFNARLGQCFSTTRAIPAQPNIVEIPDVEHNRFVFSDGVGKLSSALAQVSAKSVGLSLSQPPSVFQFRMGGCKGILTVWPDLPPEDLHIRFSQYKFAATHEGLEIIRWSQFTSAHLNRQIILVLSSLGVPNQIFVEKMQDQLNEIDEAMSAEHKAINILQRDVDRNQMTLHLADLIRDGLQVRKEPFVLMLLRLWRAWTMKYLKEKARIFVPQGALLLGCMDETGILRGHFKEQHEEMSKRTTLQERIDLLPQVFVQLSSGSRTGAAIITGPMLLTRNPALHPGDVRVVCGVDVPALRHLSDCIVFPRTGDRDIPNMCAGGDLDGDDYTVIWDSDLLPQEWNHEPMSYVGPAKPRHPGEIAADDLTTFFVTYMKNDSLSRIAHAHLANADKHGIKDEKCLRLAELHSLAVDYVKTGHPAQMTKELQPYDWPHFMSNKPADKQYRAQSVLGQLFDEVEKVAFDPDVFETADSVLLRAYVVDESLVNVARMLKQDYDSHMRRIMAQYAIGTEYEVWSGFVLQHNSPNDYGFHEKINSASTALKDHHRALCIKQVPSSDFSNLLPLAVAMYQVAYEELSTYQNLREDIRLSQSLGLRTTLVAPIRPLISFPWLLSDVLRRISRMDSSSNIVYSKPIPRLMDDALTVTIAESSKMKRMDILPQGTGIINTVPEELHPPETNGDHKSTSNLSRTGSSNSGTLGWEPSTSPDPSTDETVSRETSSSRVDLSTNGTASTGILQPTTNGTLMGTNATLNEPASNARPKQITLRAGRRTMLDDLARLDL